MVPETNRKLILTSDMYIEQKEYWVNKLSGHPVKTELLPGCVQHPAPQGNGNQREKTTMQIPPDLTSALLKLSQKTELSLYIIFLSALKALINRYTGSEDIITISPLYKINITEDTLNHFLFIRQQHVGQMTFKQLLLQVRQTVFDAYENQDYPFDDLIEFLYNSGQIRSNELRSNVECLMQNIHPYDDNDYLELDNQLVFLFLLEGLQLKGTILYNPAVYDSFYLEQAARHFVGILECAVENINTKIADIDFLTTREKARLIDHFNQPGSGYITDGLIHQQFEEQAAQTPTQTALLYEDHHLTYSHLNTTAQRLARRLQEKGVKPGHITGIMVERSLEMIVGILAVLKAGAAYLPIDPEYPLQRIEYMIKDSGLDILLTQPYPDRHPQLPADIIHLDIQKIETPGLPGTESNNPDAPGNLAYIIYTSGSTGKPKGVMINHANVLPVLNWFGRTYHINNESRVLQAANICFDVSIEEIFVPLIFGAVLFIPGKETMLVPKEAIFYLEKHQVSIVQFVPVMLKHILGQGKKINCLEVVICGGEKLDESLKNLIIAKGYNLYNHYGPTEVTVDAAVSPCDGAQVTIGKPIPCASVYIVDKNKKLLPIGIPGEMCIGGTGLARGYLNQPELTAEKFTWYHPDHRRTPPIRIYHSGDMGRWLSSGNIQYEGRIDQQVKIRGFRIELEEIEKVIKSYPPVDDVVVILEETTSGNEEEHPGTKLLLAYPVMKDGQELNAGDLRQFLKQTLPDYMIPSYFLQIEKIPLNPNGKIDKHALPLPESILRDRGKTYTPPGDAIEEKLTGIWQEVLDRGAASTIGIDDNFFELGGHSLSAVVMVAKVHKVLNVKLPLGQVFKTHTIRGLADYLKGVSTEKFVPIKPVEKRDYYPLSSAQKRLYIIRQMEFHSTVYNMPQVFPISQDTDMEKIKRAFIQLIHRHESLRTSFQLVGDEPVQVVHDEVEFEIEYYDLQATDEGSRLQVQEHAPGQDLNAPGELTPPGAGSHHSSFIIHHSFVRPFDLSRAPLLRVGLIKTGDEGYILLVDMHHIISDGFSEDTLAADVAVLHKGEKLPPLRIQYKDFSQWQNSEKEKEIIRKQEAYWISQFADGIPVLDIATDYPRPAIQSFAGDTLYFEISPQHTGLLKAIVLKEKATLYMVVLAVFNVLLSKISRQEDIVIGTHIAGRRHADLQNVIGMFVNTLVLRNQPNGTKTFREFLLEVKEKALNAFENQEYQFEDLVDKVYVNKTRDAGRNPLFDVVYTLQSIDKSGEGEPQEQTRNPGQRQDSKKGIMNTAKFDMIFSGVEVGKKLLFMVNYCKKLFKKQTIERLIDYFIRLVTTITKEPGIKLWQIEIISQPEKQRILYDFNHNDTQYPKDKTLQQLFQQQAEKNPDNIAILEPQPGTKSVTSVTYKQLNEKSNQLAHLLRAKGAKPDTIVGMMMERSIDMIVGILGILKSGAAYLPLDPLFPVNRLDSMLEDCDAPILLAETPLVEKHSFTKLQELKAAHDRLLVTGRRAQIRNFDQLPIPDRSMVNYEKYAQYIGQGMVKNSITMQATRGCPYNCAYCCRVWPKTYVTRSAENIFVEVRLYYNMGIRRFVFIDDIFNLDIQNSSKFFQLIIDHGLKVQFLFPSGLRGDILTKEYIDLMVQAGVISFPLALETASPRLQKLIGKNLNIEKLRENMIYIIENHPHVILELHTMHGFPTETKEEAMMTLDFIKSLKWLHFPYIHILKIYPNTRMKQLALESGIPALAISRSENLAYHQLPETLPFNKNFTLQYQTDFLNNYFLSKKRLLHVLPYQMKLLTENEIVQKYTSYLPTDINSFEQLLEFLGITRQQLGVDSCVEEKNLQVPDLNRKMAAHFPRSEPRAQALKILLLDLSQLFSKESQELYDVKEQPLGLMYLLAFLKQQLGNKIAGKIAKSWIDFDNYADLKALLNEFQPDVIGLRTLTIYNDFFHKTAAVIRHWGVSCPIIAGGPYATSGYETLLQDSNITLAVLGEGEMTLAQLIEQMIENGKQLPGEETLKGIDGIAFIPRSEQEKKKFAREILMWNELQPVLAHQTKENPIPVNRSTDLAYVIYTSGSTGKPKGTLTKHHNVNRVVRNTNYIDISKDDRLLQLSNYAFDGSVFDIYGALSNGSALVMLPAAKATAVDQLGDIIKREQITVFFVTTALFNLLVDERPDILDHIRKVLFGGERVSVEHTRKALEYAGERRVIHVYGPTETTVYATFYDINTIEKDAATIPIGAPLSNTSVYILDNFLKPMPIGVIGEMYIGGCGTARGYLNQPELTAEKFILDPNRIIDEYRLYKTGDLAKWHADGNIEFSGRIDDQVKIRGFRIEPGEIETHLLNHEEIKEVVVTIHDPGVSSMGITSLTAAGAADPADRYICAYIVTGTELSTGEIREYLTQYLPDYMIPSYIMRIEQIPLTPNGKIDYKALPAAAALSGAPYSAPRDSIEKKLAEIWMEVLGKQTAAAEHPISPGPHLPAGIGIDDNFFDIGGHSLRATVMAAKIHKMLNIKIPLAEVFRIPTIRGLAEYIKEAEEDKYAPITPVEKKEYYALSSAQMRLYILQQVDLDNTVYNMPEFIPLPGKPEVKKLQEIFIKLINRHESLRTSFHMISDEPVQKVHEKVEFEIQYSSVSDFIRPFDLTKAPLLRVGLQKTGETRYLLMIDMHHIISDGVSNRILVKDFITLDPGARNRLESRHYADDVRTNARGAARQSMIDRTLEPLRIQYKDFSQWQNNEKEKDFIKKQEAYWTRQFTDQIPVLDITTDYPRPAIQSFEGDVLSFEISPGHTSQLKAIVLREKATPYMGVLAVFNILLSKISSQEDIVIGTPVAGRRHADLLNVIGMFVNTLTLRNQPKGTKTFLEFLLEVKKKTLEAFENQEYQFEDLVEKVSAVRDASRNPLFDVMFTLENLDADGGTRQSTRADIPRETREAGKTGTGKEIPNAARQDQDEKIWTISKFDLTLHCTDAGENLLFMVEYCTRLFKQELIERFTTYFQTIISSIVNRPSQELGRIEILSEEEKRQILHDFNETGTGYPKDKTIHELFEEQAAAAPANIAIVYENIQLTYGELKQRVNQLAHLLIAKGVRPDTIAAIQAERSIEMVAGILGILEAGAAYMPIDPAYPEERINYMLKDSNAEILLKHSDITLETFNNRPKGTSSHLHLSPAPAASLAYVIYTSGSTGMPKGVMIEHGSVVNILFYLFAQYPLYQSDTYLFKTSYMFDVSVSELFGWFLGGGRLALLEPGAEKNPLKILEVITRHQVTHINFVPTMFNVFVDVLDKQNIESLSGLKYIFLAGEALLPGIVNKFRELGSAPVLENIYGPTEAAIYAAKYSLSEWDGASAIYIGKPVGNVKLYILDQYHMPRPVGIAGELYIAGKGLARGYLNNPGLTSRGFIDLNRSYKSHMSYKSYESHIFYSTGDLARWQRDGNIEFLGRIDHQVKIRGFRIELEEIESQLLNHIEVKEALVLAKTEPRGDKYLCAYVVLNNPEAMHQSSLVFSKLRKHLSQSLPDYMIPAYFVPLETMPLTPNGKINRKALPHPKLPITVVYSAPRNNLEEKLAAIWAHVLALEKDKIGIDSNFFELGGHSLKVNAVISRIHKELHVIVPMMEMFRTPTIRKLAEYIQHAEGNRYTAIAPVENKEYYPVSSAQKRMYLLHQMEFESTVYNMPELIPIRMARNISTPKLLETFQKLIHRHESLRTSFELIEEEPVQRIHPEVEFEIKYYDKKEVEVKVEFEGGDTEETRGLAPLPIEPKAHLPHPAADIISSFIRPFDLSRAPLLRVGLIKFLHTSTAHGQPRQDTGYSQQDNEDRCILMIDMHHIICDGISHQLLAQEFAALTRGKQSGSLRIQYKDYTQWQDSEMVKENIKRQELYWLNEFAGEIPVLNLPTDYTRPAIQSFEGDSLNFAIDRINYQALKKYAREKGVTLFMLLLAITHIWLSKLGGQEDIIIGTPIAGRRHEDLLGIIGMFVNTLPLRNYPKGEKTFAEFLQEVRTRTLAALENQEYPFEDLVEKVPTERDISRNPLFDVMFTLENFDADDDTDAGTRGRTGTEIEKPDETRRKQDIKNWAISKFDLSLNCTDSGEHLLFSIEYCTKLFKHELIERFIAFFQEIVSSISKRPSQELRQIEIISEAEKKQVLRDFNETGAEFPNDKTLHQLFDWQVIRTPDKVALIYNNRQLTYRELNKKSHRLAQVLKEKRVKPGDIVLILLNPSLDIIVSILAVLKSGGAYVPLDPQYPGDRIKYIMNDSHARLLLYRENISQQFEFAGEVLNLADIKDDVYEDKTGDTVMTDHTGGPRDTAYIIYTSGSTGRPRGVLVRHSSVVNLVFYQIKYFQIKETERILQSSSISFDASVEQIYISLLSGAALVLVDKADLLDGERFETIVSSYSITHIDAVPSFLNTIYLKKPYQLKQIVAGGDICPLSLAREWEHKCDFYNIYGPTETTVTSTEMLVKTSDSMNQVPIGKPIANTKIYILDRWEKPVPPGMEGQIYIGGDGVAMGYLNHVELTAEKFVISPSIFSPTDQCPMTNDRLYKTGDLARWLPDGNIEFLGRIDHQVKIRGYRIELGEIENILSNHYEVKEVLVITRGELSSDKILCAYVVLNNPEAMYQSSLVTSKLRKHLSQLLPDYMIPTYFTYLTKFPLTPNGKIDRKALPKPELDVEIEEYIPPQNKEENMMVEIWSEVLEMDKNKISISANFFQLGGHSLKANIIVSKIHKALQVSIPLAEFFKNPTIKALVEYILVNEMDSFTKLNDENLVLLKAGNNRSNHLFMIHDGTGDVEGYMEFCNLLINDFFYWGIRLERLQGFTPQSFSIENLAKKYIGKIKKVQPHGPYHILGWSLGGTITFEIARQLENMNEKINFLALIDSLQPQKKDWKIPEKFSLESELDFIERHSLALEIKEKLKKVSSLDQFWIMLLEHLEITKYDVKNIKKLLLKFGMQALPNYHQLGLKESCYYLNLGRSFRKTLARYIPVGKIHTPVHYFAAKESKNIKEKQWNHYTSIPIESYKISGNHFSIFKKPHVDGFAKLFNNILKDIRRISMNIQKLDYFPLSVRKKFLAYLVKGGRALLWPLAKVGDYSQTIRNALNKIQFQLTTPVHPDDIFVATYPKSGTTWMQMILYQLITDGNMNFKHIDLMSPYWDEVGQGEGEDIPALSTPPRIFKTHHSYKYVPKYDCKYIYIVRDYRDVAVSFYYHHWNFKGYRGSFDQFLHEHFLKGNRNLRSTWFQHVYDWYQNPQKLNILYIKYEDMKTDLPGVIGQLIKFCGFHVDEAKFQRTIKRTSFTFMKQHEEKFNISTSLLLRLGIATEGFIRQGKVGGWRVYFNEAQLEECRKLYSQWISGKINLPYDSSPPALNS